MPLTALIIDDEKLARDELRFLLGEMCGVEIVGEGANGIEAIDLIEMHRPELVFLDVQMPGLDGFAVLKRLLERAKSEPAVTVPQIIFATAYDQYAVQAFDVNAVDYLLKPFDRTRLAKAVERAEARVATAEPTPCDEVRFDAMLKMLAAQRGAPARLVVQSQSRLLLVDQAEICFATIDEGVIRVITNNFEGLSKCRTLEELQEQLDPALFWRAHRGFIVNINHIREVMPWFKSSYQLRMNDKQQSEIPVSRAQTKRLRELFNL